MPTATPWRRTRSWRWKHTSAGSPTGERASGSQQSLPVDPPPAIARHLTRGRRPACVSLLIASTAGPLFVLTPVQPCQVGPRSFSTRRGRPPACRLPWLSALGELVLPRVLHVGLLDNRDVAQGGFALVVDA